MSEHRRGRRALAVVAFALVGSVAFVAGSMYAVDRALERLHGKPPPSPDEFGTAAEIGTHGDLADEGELFDGAYPNNGDTQARDLERPARLSGYTVWLRSIERVPAHTYVDGYAGDYLRVAVRVFNRDRVAQQLAPPFFHVWHEGATRTPDVVGAPILPRASAIPSGGSVEGDVYLYVGTAVGELFVVFQPVELGSSAQGVWKVQ